MEASGKGIEIKPITTSKDIKKVFKHLKSFSFIGLYDGSNPLLEEQIAQLQSQAYYIKSHDADLFWLDAKCHYELLMQLDISPESLPTVISFMPGTKE